MDRMDRVTRLLARWPAPLALFPFVLLSGDGQHRPLWSGLCYFGYVVLAPPAVAARAGVLGRWSERSRRAFAARAFALRALRRAPAFTVLAWAGVNAWYSQWHFDVPWLAVVTSIAGAATA